MYLSGYENLKLVRNMYKGVTVDRLQEVVKLVGLENRIQDKVSKYSLGMRQRLGIAQAMLHKPNLLILDEPTNGLDPEGIKEIRDLLKRLAKEEHMAVFISSHNLAELENFCNKVCIIKNGMIVETSNIMDIKQEEGSHRYLVEVDNIEKIRTMLPKEMVEIVDERNFKIRLEKEQVPEFVKQLISEGNKLYEIKQEEISLEEAFLKKTGGNIIE